MRVGEKVEAERKLAVFARRLSNTDEIYPGMLMCYYMSSLKRLVMYMIINVKARGARWATELDCEVFVLDPSRGAHQHDFYTLDHKCDCDWIVS